MVQVRLFAGAREAAGAASVTVDVPAGASVGALRNALLAAHPGLQRFGRSLWIAVNGEYADDNRPVPPHAEVACFPPVSGG